MTQNKIILYNSPPSLESSRSNKGAVYPSAGIILIGTLLKKNGYDVEVIDGGYHENSLEILKDSLNEGHVLYVGMGVMTPQIPIALDISRFIKAYDKNIPVVWGGPHPTMFPEQTVRNENIDVAVINEGAFTALELARCFQNGGSLTSVKGICFKDESHQIVVTPPSELEDINELPFFDFSMLEIEKYIAPKEVSVYRREFTNFKGEVKIMPITSVMLRMSWFVRV